MAKKLTEDQINWILSVDASDAQQEIRKLVKTNRELVNVNKERRQELIKLEAQGKKETEEYRNLEAEIKKTSQAISTNNKLVGELEKKLDITGLTMSQLKAKARDLQRQLDQTVQSTHPEEYNALQNELDRVRGRMDELRASGRHVQKEMSYTEKAISKVTIAMKLFVAFKLWEYLKENSSNDEFTVNSSPFAVPVYHKLGFVDTNTEQLTDGMRYTPMKYVRNI